MIYIPNGAMPKKPNAFESGSRKVVPAVLVYPRCGGLWLMLHRNAREDDHHAGKWNGLGGKCEPDESPLETARRELEEEAGLRLPARAFTALGALHFPNFKAAKSEDWVVYVFSARVPKSELARERPCPEGALHWLPARRLARLPLWAGDRFFLPKVLAGKPFLGSFWYRGERLLRHWLTEL